MSSVTSLTEVIEAQRYPFTRFNYHITLNFLCVESGNISLQSLLKLGSLLNNKFEQTLILH